MRGVVKIASEGNGTSGKGRSLLLLFLTLCIVMTACRKDPIIIEDTRDPINLVDEPDGITYYEGDEPEFSGITVFSRDMLYSGYNYFRSPVIVTTNNGTLIVVAQMRVGQDDDPKTLVCRRSTDNGATWGDMFLIEEQTLTNVYGNQNFVLDKNTGTIHLLYLQVFPASTGNNCTMYHRTSTDDGATWSERVEVPNVIAARWRPLGPCTGIQLNNGTHQGRLFLSGRFIRSTGAKGNYGIYSDDGGVTWSLGYESSASETDGVENETTCVELAAANGDESVIYINSRNETSASTNVYRRLDAYSDDSGESLTGCFLRNSYLKTDMCQGSLFRWSAVNLGGAEDRILFSCLSWAKENVAVSAESRRRHLGLWSTFDETQSWTPVAKRLNDVKAGYSGITKTGDGKIGVIFEEGEASYYSRITYAKINEAFLDVPLIGARWDFEELTPGASVAEGSLLNEVFRGGTSRDIEARGTIAVTEGSTVFGEEAALSFDGDDYLKLEDLDTWTQFDFDEYASFTIEMIVRVASSGEEAFLMGRPYTTTWPQWYLKLEADGKVSFRIDDDESYSYIKSGGRIDDGLYHHICVTRERSIKKIKIYIDGVQSNVISDGVIGSLANRHPLYIGGTEDSDKRFKGAIDFVRITPYVKESIVE